ncbi:golgin subfamily A member 6-like protein 7 isoform X1 [Penaeus indicus]|uniref:golgin subfamily A member 6-like protein 7 isoform X1 n=1 Tax=Penaeus indicus TaxID=29960 RepID=UPI00300D25FF
MKAETKQVETEYEARLRDSNIAYNTKEDEAADLKRENRDLMMEMGRKEEEIASLKETVKQAQLHQRRCESKARKHEAEKEGLNEQIADLQEYIATLQAENNERLKSLKAKEKTKEKEAANARGELEKKLSRRDKTIEALKKKLSEQEEAREMDSQPEEEESELKRMKRQLEIQEEKMKGLLSAVEDLRLREMEASRFSYHKSLYIYVYLFMYTHKQKHVCVCVHICIYILYR